MIKNILLGTALFCASISTQADEIQLKNGSVIKGKVLKIFKDKLLVQTDFSPNIEVDFSKVDSFSTDEEHSVKLSDGQQLNGKIVYAEKEMSVKGSITKTTVESQHLAMLWEKGEKAPDYVAPFKREWSHAVALDVNKKEGNTDESNFALQASSTLKGEKDTLKLYGKYKRAETEGEKSSDERIVGADYEYKFAAKDAWYLRFEFEKDEFESLDLRSTVAAGYSRYFLEDDQKTLRGRVGTLYRFESFDDDTNEETVGLDFGLNFTYLITDFGKWYTDLTWTPSVEDFGDYRLNHESGLSLPVGSADRWKFKLGIDHDYNSRPATGREKLDTTYFSRLELNF